MDPAAAAMEAGELDALLRAADDFGSYPGRSKLSSFPSFLPYSDLVAGSFPPRCSSLAEALGQFPFWARGRSSLLPR
jgi:hypothetical protein